MNAYTVEYSRSNRATCKTCRAKIEKDALCVGFEHEGAGDFMVTDWRHLECQKKPKDVVKREGPGRAAGSQSTLCQLTLCFVFSIGCWCGYIMYWHVVDMAWVLLDLDMFPALLTVGCRM